MSDPRDDSQLGTARERDVSGIANALGLRLPGMPNNLIQVVLWDQWEQLLDRCTDLFKGFFVTLDKVERNTVLREGPGNDTIVLHLQQRGSFDIGVVVREVVQCFTGVFYDLASEMVPNASNVVMNSAWITSLVVIPGFGL